MPEQHKFRFSSHELASNSADSNNESLAPPPIPEEPREKIIICDPYFPDPYFPDPYTTLP